VAVKRDFVKTNDAEFANQVITFGGVVGTQGPAYGLTPGQISSLNAAIDAFSAALGEHQAKTDAARGATQLKQEARAALEALFRQLNQQIQANPTVTDAEKAAAGLPVRDTSRTPVPPPATAPTVLVESAERLVHRVRLMDPGRPRGLPTTACTTSSARPRRRRSRSACPRATTPAPAWR
jgi:hypothetical protein